MSTPVHHAEGGMRRRRANAVLVRRPARLASCVPARTPRALEVERIRKRRGDPVGVRDAPCPVPAGSDFGNLLPDSADKPWLAARPRAIGLLLLAGLRCAAALVSRSAPRGV